MKGLYKRTFRLFHECGWYRSYYLSVFILNVFFLPLYLLKILLTEVGCGLVLVLLGRSVEWSVILDQLRDVVRYFNLVSPLRNMWGGISEHESTRPQEKGG